MANSRKETQKAHERFIVDLFLTELNKRHRSCYKVISEPDPPEAIIQSNCRKNWVEVTAAYMNTEFAQDIWSYATPGESHKPMSSDVFCDPDKNFSIKFVNSVNKKLQNVQYKQFRYKYGPGYLIVSIQYPGYTKDTLNFMLKAWQAAEIKDLGFFKSIYLAIRQYNGYQIVRWASYQRP